MAIHPLNGKIIIKCNSYNTFRMIGHGRKYINWTHLYKSESIKNGKSPCIWWIFLCLELCLEVIRFAASEPPSVIARIWTIYSSYSPNQYVMCSCNPVSSREVLQLSTSSSILIFTIPCFVIILNIQLTECRDIILKTSLTKAWL